MKKLIFSLLFLFGCSNSSKIEEIETVQISEYEYDKARGHNAAIRQFCPDMEHMLIDLSNKKVVIYVSRIDEEEKSGYAEGYHNALNILFPYPTVCPR